MLTAVNQFKVNTESTLPNGLLLEWRILQDDAEIQAASTRVGEPLAYLFRETGRYTVTAEIVGGRISDRGEVPVRIRNVAESEEEPPDTQADAGNNNPPPANNQNNNDPPPSTTPTPTPPPSNEPPASVGGAGDPGGGFALGGQVPGTLGQSGYMQQAGMTWVKFQAKWPYVDAGGACGWVAAGKGAGYRVLLSIPGPLYPQSIDFGAYVAHLQAVAACQPDAIEVWNEMNLDREWPTGQIDPASYVNNMLAPAFNAIKSVSPGTWVVTGALAPTGFDNGTNAWSDQRYLQGMQAAGAQNYANCIGVHHNSGTTSPSARSGHVSDSGGGHYSWYFLPTVEVSYSAMGGTLPVCLTEFGYLTAEGHGPLPDAFSWGGVNTLGEQAAWLKEGADISRNLGYVRLMIVWNVGFTQYDSDPQAGYSIVRPDGTCPACDLLP